MTGVGCEWYLATMEDLQTITDTQDPKRNQAIANTMPDTSSDATKSHSTHAKGIAMEDILDLRSKGLSTPQIAKLLDCSHVNIVNRLKTVDSLPAYKRHRSDFLAAQQSKLLNSITDADVKKASMLQRVTAFGILYDKERLERDKSTANISVIGNISGNIKGLTEQISKLSAECGLDEDDVIDLDEIDDDDIDNYATD